MTIEHKGAFTEGEGRAVGVHVYGCDICQEVCPWNAIAPRSDDAAWQPRPLWDAASLVALSAATDDEMDRSLSGSAMSRAKREGLRRNVKAALENCH